MDHTRSSPFEGRGSMGGPDARRSEDVPWATTSQGPAARERRPARPGGLEAQGGGGGHQPRRSDPELAVGGRVHDSLGPAHEPEALGKHALPEVPAVRSDPREQDDRIDDRASAPGPRADAARRRGVVSYRRRRPAGGGARAGPGRSRLTRAAG